MRDVPEPAKFGKQLSQGLSTAKQREQHLQQQVGFWWLMTDTNPRTKGQLDGEEAKLNVFIKTTVSCHA